MEETNRVELDNGAVESTGTSVQIEWLRRSSKEVTSIPRPKRCQPGDQWREEHPIQRNSMCKSPVVGKGFGALLCEEQREEYLLRDSCLVVLRAVREDGLSRALVSAGSTYTCRGEYM